ncbi:MAG TPA: CBS domain-containing protein [Pseudonocardiaceae bacterium]
MRAHHVMTQPVLVVPEGESVEHAASLLTRHGYTTLPVVDEENRLVGVVTEQDLLSDPLDGRQLGRPRTVGGGHVVQPLVRPGEH